MRLGDNTRGYKGLQGTKPGKKKAIFQIANVNKIQTFYINEPDQTDKRTEPTDKHNIKKIEIIKLRDKIGTNRMGMFEVRINTRTRQNFLGNGP